MRTSSMLSTEPLKSFRIEIQIQSSRHRFQLLDPMAADQFSQRGVNDLFLRLCLAQTHGFSQEVRVNLDGCAHDVCLLSAIFYAPDMHLSIARTASAGVSVRAGASQ